MNLKVVIDWNMKLLKFIGFNIEVKDDYLESRIFLLVNKDIYIGFVVFRLFLIDYFYKNVDVDELFFVYKGLGILWMMLGNIFFEYGDYLVILCGMIY